MSRSAAAFFDVDGTLVHTTIVHYYAYFRRRRLPRGLGRLWTAGFLLKCLYYLFLDKLDRSLMNRVFYRSYAGMPATEVRAMAAGCYRDLIRPRSFAGGVAAVQAHLAEDRRPVLVTGSIDFIMEPLARELGVDDVLCPSLQVADDRFTGELDGKPVGEKEKARRIREFAEREGIDLSQSHAYGDSIADLPMLEAVGFPHAVNPDRKLAAIAKQRNWPRHRWTLDSPE